MDSVPPLVRLFIVQVDHRDRADARARQRFHDPRADSAHPDHADVRRAQPRQGRRAVEPAQPAEALQVIVR